MKSNLVYYRSKKNKDKEDFKILIQNIVNLKKNSSSSGSRELPQQFYTPLDNYDNTLIFESRFESGNLLAVTKIEDFEYHLILQNDTNTVGYNQWFFFRVKNVKKGTTIKLNILNMVLLLC